MLTWKPKEVPVVLDALRADRIASGTLTAIDELIWRELTFRFTNKKTGACFPSYATIATHAGCCCRTVGNSIKRLKEAGWLRWKHGVIARAPLASPLSVARLGRSEAAAPQRCQVW